MAASTSHKDHHLKLAREFKAKSIAGKVLVDYHKSSGNKFEATIFPAMDLIIEHDPETRITSYEIINRHGPGSEDDVIVDAGSTVGPYFGKTWSKSLCAILETHLEKYLEFAGDDAESLSRSSSRSASPEPRAGASAEHPKVIPNEVLNKKTMSKINKLLDTIESYNGEDKKTKAVNDLVVRTVIKYIDSETTNQVDRNQTALIFGLKQYATSLREIIRGYPGSNVMYLTRAIEMIVLATNADLVLTDEEVASIGYLHGLAIVRDNAMISAYMAFRQKYNF